MYQFEIHLATKGKVFESNDTNVAFAKYRELVRVSQETKEPDTFERVTMLDNGEVIAHCTIPKEPIQVDEGSHYGDEVRDADYWKRFGL